MTKYLKVGLLLCIKKGIIDYHSGNLPDFKGINILNWVHINNLNEYGITFHYVNSAIDTGDIIAINWLL